ncbi:suppressor of mec-8 and unc-52 protein homolog 2 isoform X2 [Zea mays]|uniref:suppressor of mec-8 and unc-52 protein homolog 2 isoform X2 n=1 Tax=Zea mays TaxID=4577 RepID=UPI0009A99A02|nr:suppressor of mec-8 and unc-52 protein homolog 2 isoform X2 [Zea mays]|eukprot:XP_020406217.1 suppressor of mec-8 and unc-52 protein homolog 2 isoform X2 [Zea mays]
MLLTVSDWVSSNFSCSPFSEEKKKEEPETPRYRDRAKERREDQNPDYEPTELGSFHAVAPPGSDLRLADAHKISIEKSKYLGGDLEHTHLVKGLGYALLHKVRSEIEKKPEAEDGKDAKSRATKEDQAVSFRTATAKSVYQWIIKPQSIIKENELFLPGRMSFIYNLEEVVTNDIPTTLHRSKADCPVQEEMVTVSVDGSVLDRIAKIMTYLRLGSSGKVLKKKKKERDIKGKNNLASGDCDESVKPSKINGSTQKHQSDMPPPPARPPQNNNFTGKEKQPVPVARADDDDIFVGDGVDYTVPNEEMSQSPVSDMDESPHNHQKQSNFIEPMYGPVPPSEPAQAWQQPNGYDAVQAQMAAAGYQGDWSSYVYAEQQLGYPEQYVQQSTQEYDVLADPSISQDPRFMTQADKDRGLGSVFKRDDQRLNQLREKDERERDPNFISDSYSECYPGYQEYNNEIAGSDDEDDLSKMDMGGRAKGRLHRWDFETEEEWAKYNDQKEAMPKAAFQFGVKMQDGRKTRKQNKDQKLTNDLHKINKILARKKGEKDGAEDGGHYDDDLPSSKKQRG